MTRRILLTILAVFALYARPQAQSYTLAPSPFPPVVDGSGTPINNACIWTYQAGTTTAIATYSDTSGTQNANPIRTNPAGLPTTGGVYLIAGQNYKFVYENNDCVPPAHGTVLRTQDNINGVPSSASTLDLTVTAGETISAGQCGYISDGSGGKNATQAYKCDSTADYSSSRPIVGLVPSTIASGTTGTLRLAGSVSGLSVSAGSVYYVSTAGSLTSTKPATGRRVGFADSSTSVTVDGNPTPLAYNTGFLDDFRLSLTTATCVPAADVTAATTIYLTPCSGNRITLFDSNGNPTTYTTAEISIAVPASTSQMYDIFVYANAGAPTLELIAWTNDTTRATAIARTNGRWTKSGDSTRLYVGSFRTTGVSGKTEDSAQNRLLWNYYNRVTRPLSRVETTATWSYTLTAFQQANASAANQITVVTGVAESSVSLDVVGAAEYSTTAAIYAIVAIGEDSTTTAAANCLKGPTAPGASFFQATVASLRKVVPLGYHTYVWLERVNTASGTMTWLGTGGDATEFQAGIVGTWMS